MQRRASECTREQRRARNSLSRPMTGQLLDISIFTPTSLGIDAPMPRGEMCSLGRRDIRLASCKDTSKGKRKSASAVQPVQLTCAALVVACALLRTRAARCKSSERH